MANILRKNKAVALVMVLGTLLVVLILIHVVLTVMSSQSRFTHHQVSRIQAYYAAMAGINYALERLRVRSWQVGVDCLPPTGCTVTDPDFPAAIKNLTVVIRAAGASGCPAGGPACINATVNYTYTPTP